MSAPEQPSIAGARVLLADLAQTAGLVRPPQPPRPAPAVPPPPANPASSSKEKKFVPLYPDVHAWVTYHYTVVYVRRLKNGERWCARWFDHPEAVMRMTALWRTWEQARLNELIGAAGWLRIELDHHMPILHGEGGPFSGCVDGEHRLPSPEQYPIADPTDLPRPLAAHR